VPRTTLIRKLRPRKIRNAVRRRWFERQLPRLSFAAVDGPVLDLGSSYGGWKMPGGLIEPSWVCYCVGAGGDISFDRELVERYGATVRAVDPVADYILSAQAELQHPRFSTHRAAIATDDGPLRMQLTHDTRSGSVSPAGLYESHDFIELPGRTLPSLMAELGDERIDLLKLDIEGGEYDVLPTLDLRALGVRVLATQLHYTGSVRRARTLIAGLASQGYQPVACRPAVKITFAHSDLLAAPARAATVRRHTSHVPLPKGFSLARPDGERRA